MIVVENTEKPFILRADEFWDYFKEIPLDVNIVVRLFKKTREVEIRGFKGYKKEKRKQKGLVFI
jgi:hypothetical protein